MIDAAYLRGLGRDRVAALVADRPELLSPVPPAHLAELAARLRHESVIMTALAGHPLPTFQVAEALAALGPHATLGRLLTLLGVAPDHPDRTVVDDAVATLRHLQLIVPSPSREAVGLSVPLVVVPEIVALLDPPLGLGPHLETLARGQSVEQLQGVLRAHGRAPAGRKADLVAHVVRLVGDPDHLRGLLRQAPEGLADRLVRVALGLEEVDRPYTTFARRGSAHRPDPVGWAMDRFLLVERGWENLEMPAEVALALRGPDWRAPFTPTGPETPWTAHAPEAVARTASATAGAFLTTVNGVLAAAGKGGIALLKSGGVGVRELRRVAAAAGADVGDARFAIALVWQLGLIESDDEATLLPTDAYDRWQELTATHRLAVLVTIWRTLPGSPLRDPAAAYVPTGDWAAPLLRAIVLEGLAEHPGHSTDAPALAAHLRWRRPLVLGPLDGPDPAPDVAAVIAEATRLGLVADAALTSIGAAVTDGTLPAAIESVLGEMHATARLQADLTAVVLGEPDPGLVATLDLLAVRENRSAASIWRFSPASVRRAFDAGLDAEAVQHLLEEISESGPDGVPQPLAFLVSDVARRHGHVRAGAVRCYLRADDEALLREIVADRRLRNLGLRAVAPTVVVGAVDLGTTLDALRAAGFAPVEEGPDGAAVHREDVPRRAHLDQVEIWPDAGDRTDAGPLEAVLAAATAAPDEPHDAAAQAADLASTWFSRADSGSGCHLVDIGPTVVDVRAHDTRTLSHLFD